MRLIKGRDKNMKRTSEECERSAILHTAELMCAAARTAPKTKGTDHIETCVLTGEEKDALADKMEELSGPLNKPFFVRDADNVRKSEAVVLIGTRLGVHGLNEACQYCGFTNCAACTKAGSLCAYDNIDLGIAVGSAVSVAADCRIDNRIMFSVGRTALEMGILGKDVHNILGIPLSVLGKSPFFDRKA